MASSKLKLANAKGRLTRVVQFVNSINSETPVEMLEIRLKKLDEAWSDYSDVHDKLLQTSNDEEFTELEAEFGDYETWFFCAHASITQNIRKMQTVASDDTIEEKLALQQYAFLESVNSVSKDSSCVHLPKLEVPSYSGDYKEWPSFRDMFLSAVDNKQSLTGSQKFKYLKSYLRGDAANFVRHMPISEANYFEAWKRLEKRYDRSNLIVQSLIQTFISLPTLASANVHRLRRISDSADEVIRGLNALGCNNRDPWVIYLLINKLDIDTKHAWAELVGPRNDCTIDELLAFLESRCDAFEAYQPVACSSAPRMESQSQIRSHIFASLPQSIQTCPNCGDNHILAQCSKFIDLDIKSRRWLVKTRSLCFLCFRAGHSVSKCRSLNRCQTCNSRHHSLVHVSTEMEPEPSSSNSNSSLKSHQPKIKPSVSSPLKIINNHSIDGSLCKQTILPTILANVQDSQGKFRSCRVLIDSGSQVSFVVESLAQSLGVPRSHAKIPILGVSSSAAVYTRGCISLKLCSRHNQDQIVVDAFVLTKLTSNLPSQYFDTSTWSHIRDLELADPAFNISGPIDVLLGADKLWCILKGAQIRGSDGKPIAQKTSFGWVVTGELLEDKQVNHMAISTLFSAVDIDTSLQRFWKLDEIPTPKPQDESLQDEAELHFQGTFSRSTDGRYVVQLPFNTSSTVFGNSLKGAVNRLKAMERRFQKNQNLHKMYVFYMQEYLRLGHMVPIPSTEFHTLPEQTFYLPHHAVLKPESSATKLRVVFDGSAKDTAGNSLNSMLLINPAIQRDLIGVSLRFRQHRYVFTADIVKMFRQIWISDRDADFQRIVWRENPSDDLAHFRLRTVTYGTASAPHLSVRVLKQIALDYGMQYPKAARVLLEDVYVDDIMTGANSPEDLISLQSELVAVLSNAKLELGKWTSNCWPLLSRLPKDDCEFGWFDVDCSKALTKLLCLFWNPSSDEFSFKVSNCYLCACSTRRTLLSEVSRIFDPLGFLAPSVILLKLLFQELWSAELNLNWDDPLPTHLEERWTGYQNELRSFESIRVPRHIFASFTEIELHGFCNASTLAYAAVVYARCKIEENKFKVVLIAAKTKLAPLKGTSTPRLELCGAVLLSRLMETIKSSIPVNFRVFAWCDSEIVLHWLSSPPCHWTTFVANRTVAILEKVPLHAWSHIVPESNPANCASHGVSPSQLNEHHLWWNGPSFLSSPQELWEVSMFSMQHLDSTTSITEEERQMPKQSVTSSVNENLISSLIERSSSWRGLNRTLAYCHRFIAICRPNNIADRSCSLTVDEIGIVKLNLLRYTQQKEFGSEIQNLIQHSYLPAKSKLIRYSPFVDQHGLLRIGGRMKNADVSFQLKHPILLGNSHISHLIVEDIHNTNLHPGVSETFAIVRQQYWILGSRNLIRKIIHKCRPCFLHRKQFSEQLMGKLPQQRITPSRPFTHTECDYAGPFSIKLSHGRRKPKVSKAYFALFICVHTKAIHIELVSDLTSDAFLAAFRRFVSRRGKSSHVYTDNGTNFQGARRCLNEMQKLVLSQTYNDQIAASLALDGITWHFISTSAPHVGGLWEAGVKSIKLHLRRVVGANVLIFEEMSTVLCEIEGILNSRPLCATSDNDLNPLTPAYFLEGESHATVPEANHLKMPQSRLSRWNLLQNMTQGFWKRWHAEYITTLQERPKWQRQVMSCKVGDLVVIKEPNLPPAKWLLGKVEVMLARDDNAVRDVTVRTSRGLFVRPISKIAVLPRPECF